MKLQTIDWDNWMRRWEIQQGRMRHREARFEIIVDAVRTQCGETPRVLDLGCGPGSLGVRIVQEIPGATVVGVDMDPVLLELGQHALRNQSRIGLVDADLRDRDLVRIGDGFDAAVSTTALHWLLLEPLQQLYQSLGRMLRRGGIFLNGDWMHGTGSPAIDRLLANMGGKTGEPDPGSGETWEEWWEAILAEPELEEAAAERRRRRHGHPDVEDEELPTLLDHESALRAAGFAEIGILWQFRNSRVLAAIR